MNKSWASRIWVAISQLVNVVVFNGMPDEMLSARAFRENHKEPWATMEVVLNCMFFWQEDHCYQCYLWEKERIDSPYKGEKP